MNYRAILLLVLHQACQIFAGNGEIFEERGQKNYEEDEEGKIVPHR